MTISSSDIFKSIFDINKFCDRPIVDNGDVLRMLAHITQKTNYGKHYAVKDKQHEFDYLQRHFKVMLHSLHDNDNERMERMERMEFSCSIQLRYKFCSIADDNVGDMTRYK
uniref:Uncharacterized protein n=1 Tax=Glossina austeni TaxID=7395 RepID=A0A1A9VCL3_GLOAU